MIFLFCALKKPRPYLNGRTARFLSEKTLRTNLRKYFKAYKKHMAISGALKNGN